MQEQATTQHRQHHINLLPGEAAPTVLIPGDPGRVKVFADLMDEAWKVTEKREFITYTGRKDGVLISCTSTGLGSPPTAIGTEELFRIGTKNIIRIGTCGAIQPFCKPGDMIIATGAVRGERTSEELIPVEYPAAADFRIVRALIDACERLDLPYHVGIIRTHDAYYMESPQAFGDYKARLQKWVDLGVLALDNESSALFIVSSLHGIRAGTILASGNSIFQENADDVDWESNVRKMIRAGIEAAKILHERELD